MSEENLQKNMEVIKRVEEIAEAKNATASQIALAWVLHRGNDIIPIPGTKREKYLIENIEAVNISLSEDEMNELNKLSDLVAGDRYDQAGMSLTLQ